jgi:hypothetical protein
MRRVFLVLGVILPLAGCSGSSDSGLNGGTGAASSGGAAYEPMFGPPSASGATPDALLGLWGVVEERAGVKYDIRMRIADGTITMAGKCGWRDGLSITVGTSGAARIAPKADKLGCFAPRLGGEKAQCGQLAVLESKTQRETRGERFCSVELKPVTYEYALAGTDLSLSQGAERLVLVKLSD